MRLEDIQKIKNPSERWKAYLDMGKVAAAMQDESPRIRLKAFRLNGFPPEAFEDENPDIRQEAEWWHKYKRTKHEQCSFSKLVI